MLQHVLGKHLGVGVPSPVFINFPESAAGAVSAPLPRTGVVRRVSAAARTAVVAWLAQAADGSLQALPPGEAGETVSVYSIAVRPSSGAACGYKAMRS